MWNVWKSILLQCCILKFVELNIWTVTKFQFFKQIFCLKKLKHCILKLTWYWCFEEIQTCIFYIQLYQGMIWCNAYKNCCLIFNTCNYLLFKIFTWAPCNLSQWLLVLYKSPTWQHIFIPHPTRHYSKHVCGEWVTSFYSSHTLTYTKLKHTPQSLSANLFKLGVGCLNLELKVQIQN